MDKEDLIGGFIIAQLKLPAHLISFPPSLNSSKGGAEDPESVRDLTRGHFDSNLVGCVRSVVVMGQSVDPSAAAGETAAAVSGMNVYDCSDGLEGADADER